MQQKNHFNKVKRICTGLAFMLFPLVFVFAFSVHPNLLSPRLLGPLELIRRAHQNNLLQFGHVLVTLNTGLLVVAALHFYHMLERTSETRVGWIGAIFAIGGALMLAADKGALCLTMSALDTLPELQFTQMLPGILTLFNKAGYLWLLWGIVLLPIGFTIQAIGLIKTRVLPRWQSILFLIGVLLVATPDGMEIVNLTASILMAVALVPYGVKLIQKQTNKACF